MGWLGNWNQGSRPVSVLMASGSLINGFTAQGYDIILAFTDFGDAIVWETGSIKSEGTRLGLQEVVEGQYLVEYNAGLCITAKGFEVVTSLRGS